MKAVLFDLDDTLIVEEPAAVEAFLAVGEVLRRRHGTDPDIFHETIRRCARTHWHQAPARQWCLAVGISSWEGLWADFEGDQPEIRAMRAWSPEYRRLAWMTALDELGIGDRKLADEMAARFVKERDRRHYPYPELSAVLEALSATHRMAIVTNGLACHQWRKLKRAKLERFFETVVISSDFGIGKPAPGMFSRALAVLGAQPSGACMVGDSLSSDVAGAQASGIRAIWLNRDGRPLTGDVTPDATITSLDQLAGILGPGA